MADDLTEALDELDRIRDETNSAIELYRVYYATPTDDPSMRFWVQNELDRVQASLSSADQVVGQLAGILRTFIDSLDATDGEGGDNGSPIQGPQGPQGPEGPQGPPGAGSSVYVQSDAPVGVEGDIWLELRT